ncbi:MAG: DUF1566 domain-containing protein [Rhodanobacteraceae bacterium]|nr:DUF1566 domain-containing protein [Rhodanobacteraceae bacterium]
MKRACRLAAGLGMGLCILPPAAWANCALVAGNLAATPDARFTLSAGVVTDTVTGLGWKQVVNGPLTWAAVQAAAAADTTGGFSDWRLPAKDELETIVETGCALPSLNTTFFTHGTINAIWTSTLSPGGRAWYVHFGYGNDGIENVGATFGARFVRGGNVSLFKDGFDG